MDQQLLRSYFSTIYELPTGDGVLRASLDGETVKVHTALPDLDRRIAGFAGSDAVLLGPETRASCPGRIERDRESRACPAANNLYPIGEGAGYAGGIISAAIDGIRSAESVIARYAIPIGG